MHYKCICLFYVNHNQFQILAWGVQITCEDVYASCVVLQPTVSVTTSRETLILTSSLAICPVAQGCAEFGVSRHHMSPG